MRCEPEHAVATVLWFHGGGYRLGSARNSTPFGVRLSVATGARVVLVDYALAPEHPFPAAVHDAAGAYEGARATWGEPLLVGGDSAGGGLALAVGAGASRAGVPPPTGTVVLSPWCDLTVTAASYASRAASDPLFSAAAARQAADLYLQGWPTEDPLASPLFAEDGALGPTMVLASTDEVLLDDARGLVDRLAGAGAEVWAHFAQGVPHVWPTLYPDLPASQAALEGIATFVRAAIRARDLPPRELPTRRGIA